MRDVNEQHSISRRALGVAVLLCLFAQYLFAAASPEERRAFDAASKAFQDGVLGYERAEREFGEFAKNFPMSERRSEAILFQARSRYYMTNSAGAVELLAANLPQNGKLADEYQFWLGEALFLGGKFASAAEAYAKLVNTFMNSPRVLAASYSEALCRSKLGELKRVVELLQPPAGAFQRAARAKPRDEWVARGGLLLAETLLELRDYKAGETALNLLDPARLAPDLAWRRQYVLCRLQQADGRDNDALANTTQLLALAKSAKDSRYQAESAVLRGSILSKLGRYDDAIAAYSANLTTNVPPEFRRQALLKNIELTFAQNKVADTIHMLEDFSAQSPADPALDLAQATLGELRLKEFFALTDTATNALPPAATNLLAMALTNATRVITGFTNSPYLGRAHYTRGWVLWNEGREGESLMDFHVAAERLPKSEEQAVARYKLAEAQMLQKDYTNAITNFSRILADFADFERVKSTLFDQVLYKIVRAAIAAGDLKSAEDAARKILLWYPDSFFSDRGLLLLGQAFNHRGEPAEARVLFQDLITHFPNSALAPEANLAIARTYKQEHDWASAAAKLNEWVALYKTNAALPSVEFERASLIYQAGDVTNAVRQFTNFVARFPADTNAPLAQMWLGNFFFNQGAYDVAEANYQRVFQNTNWQSGLLPFEARLAAGRAAFFRQGYKDATNYFLTLINDPKCPQEVLPAAYFALGDTYFEGSLEGVERFGDAIKAWAVITNNLIFPSNALAPRAMGKIGDAHFARANTVSDSALQPVHYQNATNAYLKAMAWPGADLHTRSMAEIGLGLALEKLKKPKESMDHLLNVIYETNKKDDEPTDLFAIKAAGLEALRTLEERQDWSGVIRLCERLREMLPMMREIFDKKIRNARKMLESSPKI